MFRATLRDAVFYAWRKYSEKVQELCRVCFFLCEKPPKVSIDYIVVSSRRLLRFFRPFTKSVLCPLFWFFFFFCQMLRYFFIYFFSGSGCCENLWLCTEFLCATADSRRDCFRTCVCELYSFVLYTYIFFFIINRCLRLLLYILLRHWCIFFFVCLFTVLSKAVVILFLFFFDNVVLPVVNSVMWLCDCKSNRIFIINMTCVQMILYRIYIKKIIGGWHGRTHWEKKSVFVQLFFNAIFILFSLLYRNLFFVCFKWVVHVYIQLNWKTHNSTQI